MAKNNEIQNEAVDQLNASEPPSQMAMTASPYPAPRVPLGIEDIVPEVDQQLEMQESDLTQPRNSDGRSLKQSEELDALLKEIKDAE